MRTGKAERVVVFDLDDTLYLERDFVASGFTAVGAWLAGAHGRDGFAAGAWRHFEAGRRGDIFDATLFDLGMEVDPALIAELVRRYRDHDPDIALADDAAAWLAAPPPGTAIALLTDGVGHCQAKKFAALGLTSHGLWPVVMTGRLGRGFGKPHPRGYCMIADTFDLPPDCFTYVADNAAKDFVTPRRLGWNTVQIVRPGGLHQQPAPDRRHAADKVISSLPAGRL